jgi:uncharacterized protein (TIGR03435 family)
MKCMSIYATNIKRLYLPKGYRRERVNIKSLRIILFTLGLRSWCGLKWAGNQVCGFSVVAGKITAEVVLAVAPLNMPLAQGQAPEQVEFEVASVKPAGQRTGMMGCYNYRGGRIFCGHSTLEMLIEHAFAAQPFEISGGPDWVHTDTYEVNAIPPSSSKSAGSNPSSIKNPFNDEQRQMLQALLEKRFQLQWHRAVKDGPIYLLTLRSKKPKLDPPKDKGTFSWVGSPQGGALSGDGLEGQNISMPLLATRLSPYLGRPVVDKTGLSGFFDFKVDYGSDDADLVPWIFRALETIGLKLKPAKGPVETIFIDHATKPPQN